MFHKKKKPKKKHDYDLSFENVAIPEIHTHHTPEDDTDEAEPPAVDYDNLAIPEVHIQKKGPITQMRKDLYTMIHSQYAKKIMNWLCTAAMLIPSGLASDSLPVKPLLHRYGWNTVV